MTITRDSIAARYRALGYQKGWGFVACPEKRLYEAEVAIVGLNPGGGGADDAFVYSEVWDTPEGNAYFKQKWGKNGAETPVQGQVRAWHRVLGLSEDETLCAQFIPFRSPDYARLGNQAEAIAFARELWTWVLDESPATLFITMGKLAGWHIADLLGGRLVAQLPTGWKRQMIDVYYSPSKRRVVAMPHPSRFTLFDRGAPSEIAEQSLRAAADVEGRP
jgi:hypothetical protein